MASLTTGFTPILAPEEIAALVIKPLIAESIAGIVLTSVMIGTHDYRIPCVTADPSASWTAEGAEIAVSDPGVDELQVTPSKLAALVAVSSELANDSNPAAADVIGKGITRDLQRKVDQALFSAATVNGPSGIPSVTGVSSVDAGTAYTNVDAFSDAIYNASMHNGTITAWVTNPETAMALAKVKSYGAAGSNVPLLGPDPTTPGQRQILGVPLLTSPYVDTTDNAVWGISKSQAFLVIREKADVESDRSVFFGSDRIAIRATLRIGFGFPNPPTLVKITTSG